MQRQGRKEDSCTDRKSEVSVNRSTVSRTVEEQVWAKAAATVADVENLLTSRVCGKSPGGAWGLDNVTAECL